MKIKLKDMLDDACKKHLSEMAHSFNVPESVLLNMIICKAYDSFVESKEPKGE